MGTPINRLLLAGKATDIFLLGRCGAGKTTLALDMMETASNVRSIFPGKVCREKFGDAFFTKQENSVTPAATEELVRQTIADALSLGDVQFTVIDGFPRSPEQVRWALSASKNPVFIHVTCAEQERLRRLRKRNDSAEAAALNIKRNEDESRLLLYVLEELSVRGADIRFFDNTTHNPNVIDWPDNYKHVKARTLDSLFAMIRVLSEGSMEKWHVSPLMIHNQAARRGDAAESTDLCVEWLSRFTEDLRREVDELAAELPTGWRDSKTVDLRSIRVELADIMHFLVSAAETSGLTATEFYDIVEKKCKVNMHRLLHSKKKGDDAHLGKKLNNGPVVYLAGPIFHATSHNFGTTWRNRLQQELGHKYTFLDPVKRRTEELGSADAVKKNMHIAIKRDLEDIASADAVVFYSSTRSAGSAMEEFFAKRIVNVPVIFVKPANEERSGWLYDHASLIINVIPYPNQIKSDLIASVDEALEQILG